jgi:cation:H+ antiporter
VSAVLLLVVGFALAAVGGELFVRGAVGGAVLLRVPAGAIGATVVAFATSSPEMSVAVQAARSGTPEVALGDALGSNVVNIGLVLGLTVALGSLAVRRRDVRRELAVAAAAPALTIAVLVDGRMVRAEAFVLLAVFVVWLVFVTRDALRSRDELADPAAEQVAVRSVLPATVAGIAALLVAGNLIVVAAKDIGDLVGLDSFTVGATMVAAGTSAPELATAIIARRRGHIDVGVGTVLGSNVFNNLWIVGIAGFISPMEISAVEVVVAVGACLAGLLFAVPNRRAALPRTRGLGMLAVLVLYTFVTLLVGSS